LVRSQVLYPAELPARHEGVHYKRKTAIKQWRDEEFIKKPNQPWIGGNEVMHDQQGASE
jgi:hypothetical protein